MKVFTPGDHGSTFGGNPLACAVAIEALNVLIEEDLARRASEMGSYFMERLYRIKNEKIREIRGKGLLIAVEIKEEYGKAREYCEGLKELGILAKATHGQTIRFAPPLIITRKDIDFIMERIIKVLE